MPTEQKQRYWSVEQDAEGWWSFSYICYESDQTFETREMAMEALIDMLVEDNQRLLIEADDDD